MMPISFKHISTPADWRKTHLGARARIPTTIIFAGEFSATLLIHVSVANSLTQHGKSDAWTKRCLEIRASRAGFLRQPGPLARTRAVDTRPKLASTGCILMWNRCVGGEAWSIDNCSWCGVSELAQSGSRVRFVGEDDKRVMIMMATVVVSPQDPQYMCAQLIFGGKNHSGLAG